MWMSCFTPGSISMAAWMASRCLRLADSPMSRLFISITRTMAMMPSSTPIEMVP